MRAILAMPAMLLALGVAPNVHGQSSGDDHRRTITRNLPVGVFVIHVEGTSPLRVMQPGIELDDGLIGFRGRRVAVDGSWTARWDYVADLDPREGASIKGACSFQNKSSGKLNVDMQMLLPIDPVIDNACVVRGSVALRVAFDGDGGTMDIPLGMAGWHALIDGKPLKTCKKGPMVLAGVANTIAETSEEFGLKVEGEVGPGVNNGFGSQHQFRISSGEVVTCLTHLILEGSAADFLRRRDTHVPVSIGASTSRLKISLSGQRASGRTGSRSPGRNDKGTLIVRPAHIRDHNVVEGVK